jgi:uncharacterized protein YjbI with pentapeptide repeats
MTGLRASGSHLSDVAIEDCRLDLAVFAEATIEHTRIVRCDLRGSSWQAADLRAVSFEDRDAAELRGISMPWEDVVANAALFATPCGIEIEAD